VNSTPNEQPTVLRSIAAFVFALSLPYAVLASPPAAATQHGYTVNTYTSNFTAQTVDMNQTVNRGYKWYLFDVYSKKASPAGIKINSDGSVTLTGDYSGALGALASVSAYRGTNNFVGTAFGGGAYIEAVMSFDPAMVTAAHAHGWAPYPAFWALPMEGNFIQGAEHWPGQPAGFTHSVEVDFFEADSIKDPTRYGVALHDWWGIHGETCSPGLCKVSPNPVGVHAPPAGTDFKQFHTYGFLWVPATATTPGFVDAYFDGQRTGYTVSWTQFTNQPPTPAGKPWAFGRLDQQRLFFILGTGRGEPLTVKSVEVWQRNISGNLTN
jgi:hypothetical protein